MNLIFLIGGIVGESMSVAVIAMLVACLLPFLWAVVAKGLGGFRAADNKTPREFLVKLTGLPARANAIQANSFESLPMFLAGVILAMYCFVPQLIINGLACFYVLLRVAYGLAYLGNLATLRSIFWTASMACVVMLFVLAARAVA